jgi:RNA polymerase sigma factor (sigma-70 family)
VEEYLALTWDQVEPEDHAQEQAALKACMDGLGERLRQMLDLRYQDGLNATQIGERLRMSAEGVRMALMRGRNALARCLGGRLATQDAERVP